MFFLCRALKVRTLESPNPLKATYTVVHMFLVLLLASVPSLILNLPVGIVARYVADASISRGESVSLKCCVSMHTSIHVLDTWDGFLTRRDYWWEVEFQLAWLIGDGVGDHDEATLCCCSCVTSLPGVEWSRSSLLRFSVAVVFRIFLCTEARKCFLLKLSLFVEVAAMTMLQRQVYR